MKTKKSELLKVLESVKDGLSGRELIEQSTHFIFKDKMVSTYNDNIAVHSQVELDIEGAVPSKELLSLLYKWRTEDIIVSVRDKELRIEGNKTSAGIVMEEKIELPIDEIRPKKVKWKELPEGFLKGIGFCCFSAAKESVDVILSNLHINGELAESCDNFRITQYKIGGEIKDDILISVSAARALSKHNVSEYSMGDGWIHFRDKDSGFIYSCRSFSERYPDLNKFVEVKGSPIKFPSALRTTLDTAKIFSQDDSNRELISISTSGKDLTVSSKNDHGWVTETIEIPNEIKKVSFQVDPDILKDILSVTTKAIVSDSAIKFKTKDFVHVISLKV